jgi:hypothetical protein
MSALNPNRQPAGAPASTGGQFAMSARSAADIGGLATIDSRYPGLTDWEPNTEFPYPQANDLEKVIAVANIVDRGATTPEGIAEALDMSTRQGSYYANAAGYLGLIEKNRSEAITSYNLTGLGWSFVDSADEDRAGMAAELVTRMDDCEYVTTDGADALADVLEKHGDLATATAERRAACVKSWAGLTSNQTEFGNTIGVTTDGIMRERIEKAVLKSRLDLEKAHAMKSEPVFKICNGCNEALPATGICDWC